MERNKNVLLFSVDIYSAAEDIQRIMHLPMEWIGALPRQEDTRCITKFIARFAGKVWFLVRRLDISVFLAAVE